jgi:putative transposase
LRTDKGYTKQFERWDLPGDAHELTFSCYKKQKFLTSERALGWLKDAIVGSREKYHYHLWAYVFMPDHVHLLIYPPEDPHSVSAIEKTIKQSVSRKVTYYLEDHNPEGLKKLATGFKSAPYAFWQPGPGYDRNMTSSKVVHASVDYIHNNPVAAGLVDYVDEWTWSSYIEWNSPGSGPISIDREFFPRR